MANKDNKNPSNIEGSWYVDKTCANCGKCVKKCSAVFYCNGDETWVYLQPNNDMDLALCNDALTECPEGAIGKDWEESPEQ